MKNNPYSKMIEIIKKQTSSITSPSIQIGEVIESPPNLLIRVNDLQIDKDNILIADYLLKKHKREITVKEEILCIQTEDTLEKGELLAVLPVDDKQLYIILARLEGVS